MYDSIFYFSVVAYLPVFIMQLNSLLLILLIIDLHN